jgi:hypothetical protein
MQTDSLYDDPDRKVENGMSEQLTNDQKIEIMKIAVEANLNCDPWDVYEHMVKAIISTPSEDFRGSSEG